MEASNTGEYGVVDGTLTEHWHLPYDPEGEAAFFGG